MLISHTQAFKILCHFAQPLNIKIWIGTMQFRQSIDDNLNNFCLSSPLYIALHEALDLSLPHLLE